MTSNQRELARHALGLPNKRKQSYRNHFVTFPGCSDHVEWMAMAALGYAIRRDGRTLPYGGADKFWLTRAGADLALDKGEHLDAEDFPSLPAEVVKR